VNLLVCLLVCLVDVTSIIHKRLGAKRGPSSSSSSNPLQTVQDSAQYIDGIWEVMQIELQVLLADNLQVGGVNTKKLR